MSMYQVEFHFIVFWGMKIPISLCYFLIYYV